MKKIVLAIILSFSYAPITTPRFELRETILKYRLPIGSTLIIAGTALALVKETKHPCVHHKFLAIAGLSLTGIFLYKAIKTLLAKEVSL